MKFGGYVLIEGFAADGVHQFFVEADDFLVCLDAAEFEVVDDVPVLHIENSPVISV